MAKLCTPQKTTTLSNKYITLNTKIWRPKILSLHAMKNDIHQSIIHWKSSVLLHELFFIKISFNKWTQVIWLYSMTRQHGRCSLRYSKSSREAPGQFVNSNSRKCRCWIRLERPLDVSSGHPEVMFVLNFIILAVCYTYQLKKVLVDSPFRIGVEDRNPSLENTIAGIRQLNAA